MLFKGPQGCALEWPVGHGICSCHIVALAQAVASKMVKSHLTHWRLWDWSMCEAGVLHLWRAIICLMQETGCHLRKPRG